MAFKEAVLIVLLSTVTIIKSSPVLIKAGETPNPADYLLSDNIIPSNYAVDLKLPKDFGTDGTFTGSVKITFKPVVDVTTSLKLHAHKLTINPGFKLIEVTNPVPTVNLIKETHTLLTDVQMIEFSLAADKTLTKDKVYTLEITFSGKLADNMYGFYRSSYKDQEGNDAWIATTQFQPVHARTAFPCFDEPKFKATFDISIEHPKEYNALSNAQLLNKAATTEGMVKTKFAQTPIMSSYLVAFIVSKFGVMAADVNAFGNNAVWARPAIVDTGKYSFDMAPKILKAMAELTTIPYTDSTLQKLDQVAIPDFAAGAMENWGLVTYRETALLWDPVESSARNKQRVGTVVAHELAHMWFGNLITLKSWDYTWINEGFARFFEYRACAKVETTWNLDKQFVIEQHQPILVNDAVKSASVLTTAVYKPEDISERFDSITYSKGGSVIRMMENFMGTEKFFQGLKKYLTENKFKNTEPDTLWTALETYKPANLPAAMKTIMDTWTTQSGFPVVTVTASGKNVTLEQKQFLYNKMETSIKLWHIPISYTTSKTKDFDNTLAKTWLTTKTGSIENVLDDANTWIVLNIQDSAYFRVHYEDALRNKILDALKTNKYGGITELNRAKMVDDVMNLARAGILEYPKALDFVAYLKTELDYFVWYPAFSAFSYLRSRIDPNSELATLLNAHISHLMQNLYKSVNYLGGTRQQIDNHKQVLALAWACKLGHKDCVKYSKDSFEAFKGPQNIPVDPDLRAMVYCTAIRHSTDDKNWRYLWTRFTNTQSAAEASLIISSLGCTSDTLLLNEYLTKSITPSSGIRKQDAFSVFTSVISNNPKGVDIGLQFLNNNFTLISENYGSLNALSNVIRSLAKTLTTQEQINKLKTFIDANKPTNANIDAVATSAMQICEDNLKWLNTHKATLLEYLQANVAPTTPQPTTVNINPPTTVIPTTTTKPNSATSVGVTATLILTFLTIFFNNM